MKLIKNLIAARNDVLRLAEMKQRMLALESHIAETQDMHVLLEKTISDPRWGSKTIGELIEYIHKAEESINFMTIDSNSPEVLSEQRRAKTQLSAFANEVELLILLEK